ncbi:MAG: asparagine synthase (glutamine-hydrolyzing) [Bacteroidota bacterium]
MCGVAGLYGSFTDLKHKIVVMTDALTHRGPDAVGYYLNVASDVALGHRRLSILDLSENANQPFHSQCNRYVMVYNGEVFNYQEIAKSLNIQLRTSCDSEVILAAFVQSGTAFVEQLNGMFAIAIFDKLTGTLHLFRDRLGIKPLFYLYEEQSNQLAFSSEIKSLKPLLSDTQSYDHNAIGRFLHLGYIPEPATAYDKIKKFPAGAVGIFNSKELSIKHFWKPEEYISTDLIKDEPLAKQKLRELLVGAVKRRMISDVPLGTFLSGGIDSSIVTAIAQELSPKPISTFSIGFKDNKYDESKYANDVADYIGTDHHEFILSEKDAMDKVHQLLNIYDEPFADSSALPTLLVSQMARKHVSVALSGDGGDEQFMGYGMYDWAERLSNPLLKALRKPIYYGLNMIGNNRLKRGAEVLNYPDQKSIKSHIFSQEQYLFSQHELSELMISPPKETSLTVSRDNLARGLYANERQSLFDLKHYLKDDLLVKVDRASMFHSLEVRVPLLDHEIVEFTLNLDRRLKIKNGIKKYLLKQVLYDYVPEKYFERPKWGFSVPLDKWLLTDLSHLFDLYLSKEVVEELGVFSWPKVKSLKGAFFSEKLYLYNRLWALILLHKWIKNQ